MCEKFKSDLVIVKECLGENLSHDFYFQEDVRRATVLLCSDPHNPLFFNGWAYVYSMKILFNRYYPLITKELACLAKKCFEHLDSIDHSKNIRSDIKAFLMFPQKGYPDWIKLDNFSDFSIKSLNDQFKEKPFTIKKVDGKLYCILPEKPKGYKNREIPHVTLVNSDKFINETHGESDGTIVSDVEFTSLAATYSFDYALFGMCIVAKIKSEQIDSLLEKWNMKKSLHVTLFESPKCEKLFCFSGN